MNDHLFGRELFIRFTVRVFCERLSICMCPSFRFGFESGMLDLIIYPTKKKKKQRKEMHLVSESGQIFQLFIYTVL